MDVTRKLCVACILFTLVHGRIIYSKKNKVKKSQKEEQWLVDSIHYDDDYQGDAPSVPSDKALCPPVPDVTTEEICSEIKCQSDSDCSGSNRCCFNGCVFTCLVEVQPAPVVDWRKEPRRSRSGISWLVDGPKIQTPDAEPCSIQPVDQDEDPLLCPYGYVCHVDESPDVKKRKSEQGHCVKQSNDLVLTEGVSAAHQSALRQGNVCTVDNIVLLDGAKMRFQDKICRCKKGLLSCSNRKEKKPKKDDSKRKPTRPTANNKTRQRRKKNRNGKQDSKTPRKGKKMFSKTQKKKKSRKSKVSRNQKDSKNKLRLRNKTK